MATRHGERMPTLRHSSTKEAWPLLTGASLVSLPLLGRACLGWQFVRAAAQPRERLLFDLTNPLRADADDAGNLGERMLALTVEPVMKLKDRAVALCQFRYRTPDQAQ